MKLHSPEFEKRLKRTVRRTIRQSSDLRKQARQRNRARHYGLAILVRPGLSALLAGLTWLVFNKTGSLATTFAFINLWMFIWLCTRVQGVLSCLFTHPDLNALSALPIEPAHIFRWQLQKCLRASIMSLIDLIAALSVVGICYEFTSAKWIGAALVTLLSWATFLALTLLCAARCPGLPYRIIPGLSLLVGFGCLFGRDYIAGPLLRLLNWLAPEMNLLLPTGWALSLLHFTPDQPTHYLFLLLLIPMGGLIWTISNSLARLRANYEFTEFVIEPSSDLIPGETEEADHTPDNPTVPKPPQHIGLTAIEEIIRMRQFLVTPNWPQKGHVEKWLWRWYTPREKILAEFVFPNGLELTKAWRKLFRNLLIALLITFALGFIAPGLQVWLFGLGVFLTSCQALALILITGRAFQPELCSGVNIPLYAAYAIGFRELAALLFKCSFAQALPLVAFIMMLAVPIAYLTETPIGLGILLGLQASILLLALRFISITFAFSSGTNDSSKLNFRCLTLFCILAALGLTFFGLGAASMLVLGVTEFSLSNMLVAWGLLALATLCAYATFRAYGWFYHANRFDLMSLAAQRN